MKNFFSPLKGKLASWSCGRYGTDELSRFVSFAVLVLIILGVIFAKIAVLSRILEFLALAELAWVWFRTLSKNYTKRSAERAVYLRLKGRVTGFFSFNLKRWKERKTHLYFACPNCRKQLRVPKNRGMLRITCPVCGTQTEKKT